MQHTLSATIQQNLDIKKILKIQRGNYVSFMVYVDTNNKTKCSLYSLKTQKSYVLDFPTKRAESSIITEQDDGTIFLIFANTQDAKVIVNFYKITQDSYGIKIIPFGKKELTEYPKNIRVQKPEYTEPILIELSNKNRIGIITHASYDPDILQFQMSNSVIMWTIIIHPNGTLSLFTDNPSNNKMYSTLFGNMQKFSNISPDNLKIDVKISLNPSDYQLTIFLAQSLNKGEGQYRNRLTLFDTTITSINNHCHTEDVACQATAPNLKENKDSDSYIEAVMIIGVGDGKITLAYIEKDPNNNTVSLKILKESIHNKGSHTPSKRKKFNSSTLLENQTKIEFVKIRKNDTSDLVVSTDSGLIEYKFNKQEDKLNHYTTNNHEIIQNYYKKNNNDKAISETKVTSRTQFTMKESNENSTDNYEKESEKPLHKVSTTLRPEANNSYDSNRTLLPYNQNYTHNTQYSINQRISHSNNMIPQNLGILPIIMITLGILSSIFLVLKFIIKITRLYKAPQNTVKKDSVLKVKTFDPSIFFDTNDTNDTNVELSDLLPYQLVNNSTSTQEHT